MDAPEGFLEDWDAVRERFEWLTLRDESELTNEDGKLTAVNFREFLDRWHHVITEPEVREGMDAIEKWTISVERHLHRAFLGELDAVVRARGDWFMAEQMFLGIQSVIQLGKLIPDSLRASFEEATRDPTTGEPLDPERAYREAEEDLDASEAAFHQAVTALESAWPERIDFTLRAAFRDPDYKYLERLFNALVDELPEKEG